MFVLLGLLLPFLGTNASICLLVFVAIATYFYFNIRKKQSYWERKGVKVIKPTFLLGSMNILRSKSMAEEIQDTYNTYRDERYFGIYQFTLPSLVINDPDLIKQVTVKDFDHFINHRPVVDTEGDPFWSKNLLGSRDERWRDMRSTLSPTFTGSKMKVMHHLMEECAQQFVDHFKKQNQEVVELDMKETLRRYTCDVIATTAFGLKCDSLENKDNEFFVMGTGANDFSGLRIFRFFAYTISPTLAKVFKIRIIPRKYTDFFSKIIEDTVKTRKDRNILRPDMINLLLEAQKRSKTEITIEDINAHSFIFFLAGFETVSSLLSFTMYELALNPDVQERLRAEIRSQPELTYETLQNLKYLDMVVSEVLRKWPPFAMTDRQVSKEFTIDPVRPEEKPVVLEEGRVVLIPIFPVHRDARYYPDPEKFDPERFSDENKHKINPGTYLPFGAGPRNCIGARFATLESKLIVCHILKNFQVVKTGKTPEPVVLDKYQINLTAEGGMWLGLKKLNN